MPVSRVPKKDTPASSGARRVTTGATQKVLSTRAENVQSIFQMAAAACIMKGYYADAGAIDMHSEGISTEVAKLADTDPKIAKLVDSLGSVGPLGGILMAALPLGMQIAANHGKIDPDRASGLGNVMAPADLEMKIKLEIQKQRAEMLAEIKAMQEANAAAKEETAA
jgi:cysteine synthase